MRRSVQADVAALNRVRLNVEALIEDWPRLVRALDEARAGYPTGRGDGGPTGKGGHTDLSDRLRYDSAGRLLPDPADSALAALGTALDGMLRSATAARNIQCGHLRDPASANWCCNANGCPDSRKAEPGRGGRCEACYRAWCRSGRLEDRMVSGRATTAA